MERVEFENSRDITLIGNFWGSDSDRCVVMAHGFTGNKEEWGKFTGIARQLNRAGFNVLSFDFSGCGESGDDSITIEKEVEDLKSAINFCKSKGIQKFCLFGLSQGGLVSLKAYPKFKEDIETMILLAPLTCKIEDYREKRFNQQEIRELEEQGYVIQHRVRGQRDKLKIPKKLIEEKESLHQDDLLRQIDCPVLIINGEEDEIIKLEDSKKAVEKLENARLETVDDDHYYNRTLDEIVNISNNWLETHLKT